MVNSFLQYESLGNFDSAIKTAQNMRENDKNWALNRIFNKLVTLGKFNEAKKLAHAISNENYQCWGLECISIALASLGKSDEANTIAQEIPHEYKRKATLAYLASMKTMPVLTLEDLSPTLALLGKTTSLAILGRLQEANTEAERISHEHFLHLTAKHRTFALENLSLRGY